MKYRIKTTFNTYGRAVGDNYEATFFNTNGKTTNYTTDINKAYIELVWIVGANAKGEYNIEEIK